MAYFPFFTEIGGSPALIVGGGIVALRKIEKLLPYGPEITVVAEKVSEEIKAVPGLNIEERAWADGDEEGFSFVIAATDDRDVNRRISECCRKKRIPVNAVDDRELCSFIFPCLVKKGELSIGISTSGSSPTAAIELKERISDMIPDTFPEILDFLGKERELMKKSVESEHERHVRLKRLFSEAMEKGRPLGEEEAEKIRSAE